MSNFLNNLIKKDYFFFKTLYGNNFTEGVLNIFSMPGCKTRSFKVNESNSINDYVESLKEYSNLYYEVCPQKDFPEQGKRGRADTTLGISCLWFDFDVKDGNHRQKELPRRDEAMKCLDELPHPATMIVDSGNGFHGYWLFKKPWVFANDEEREQAKLLSKSFQQHIIKMGKERDWKLDYTGDLSRLLRIPGSLNHKTNPPKEVKIISLNEEIRYSREELLEFYCTEEHDKKFEYTDVGNAERFTYLHGENLRYDMNFGRWLIWNGKFWENDKDGAVLDRAKETIETMCDGLEYNCETEKIFQHKLRSQSSSRLQSMIKFAKEENGIRVTPDELDKDKWQLNCPNGTIDLRNGKLRPHRRSDLITKIIPVTYDPDAECPRFEQFLHEIMAGDQEMIDFIQRVFGYSLTGSVEEGCMFFFHGNGANGKTTLLEVFRQLIGPYSKQSSIDTFLRQSGNRVREDIALLKGARFVTVVESDNDKKLDEALIKQLTGGDKITARICYKNSFEFYPEFKIFFDSCNEPEIEGKDFGVWRRTRQIPFNVRFDGKNRDKNLLSKLLKELPGILNFCINGCLEYQKNGLNPPVEAMRANNKYRNKKHTVTKYLEERVTSSPGDRIFKTELHDDYYDWCRQNSYIALAQTSFSRMVKEKGYSDGKSNLWYWKDITFVE